MGKFWMSDDIIRVHARNLSIYAIGVYSVLACHSNKEGKTTIGIRRISQMLNISKTTVVKALKELKVYHLVVQRTNGVYQIREPGVPSQDMEVYHGVVQKEVLKEGIKERKKPAAFTGSPKWEELRSKIGRPIGGTALTTASTTAPTVHSP